MSTLAEKLRIACEVNGLGVSGSSTVLLARLVKGGDKDKKEKTPRERKPKKDKGGGGGGKSPGSNKGNF